jgi:hypothetical protein
VEEDAFDEAGAQRVISHIINESLRPGVPYPVHLLPYQFLQASRPISLLMTYKYEYVSRARIPPGVSRNPLLRGAKRSR